MIGSTMLDELIKTQALANRLLKEYGLADEGWTFSFSNRKTHVGTCFFDTKKIVFSKWYIQSHPDEIEDTIRHEIAHALTPDDKGHGWEWRRKALELGCKPERCTDDAKFSGTHRWLLECPTDGCYGGPWKLHRMSQRAWYSYCPNCEQALIVTDTKTGERYRSRANV